MCAVHGTQYGIFSFHGSINKKQAVACYSKAFRARRAKETAKKEQAVACYSKALRARRTKETAKKKQATACYSKALKR